LFVRATDGMDHGVPHASVEVRIFLRDINDNAPQFSNLPNSVTFAEVDTLQVKGHVLTAVTGGSIFPLQNTVIGTTIFRAAATDTDSGLNGIVLYRFPGSTVSRVYSCMHPYMHMYVYMYAILVYVWHCMHISAGTILEPCILIL